MQKFVTTAGVTTAGRSQSKDSLLAIESLSDHDLHQAVLSKEEMTVFQVSGALQSHESYIRIMTAINHAGLELYFKAFHHRDELPGGLGLPTEPEKLYKHLQKHQSEFDDLRSKGQITEREYLTIFPAGKKETYSQEFSFPLFQKLLQMFDRAGLDAETANSDDERNVFLQEMSKFEYILKDKKLVKKINNSDETFNEIWDDVIQILKNVKYDITRIESLRTSDLEENNKFRFALLKSEVNALLWECDDCFKTVKMNHLALDRLKGNFQAALSEVKTENNNAKTANELKELNTVTDELQKTENKMMVQKQQLNEIVPNIKFWREKNIEGDVIICDENISKFRHEVNEQTRRVGDLFNTVSFDIIHLKERAYSATGEAKNIGLPLHKSH